MKYVGEVLVETNWMHQFSNVIIYIQYVIYAYEYNFA